MISDGVFRGHFRMDQRGENLNRYYVNPSPTDQPTIFAAKSLLDHYAGAPRGPAWKCIVRAEGPSHPGTPTLPDHSPGAPLRPAWKQPTSRGGTLNTCLNRAREAVVVPRFARARVQERLLYLRKRHGRARRPGHYLTPM